MGRPRKIQPPLGNKLATPAGSRLVVETRTYILDPVDLSDFLTGNRNYTVADITLEDNEIHVTLTTNTSVQSRRSERGPQITPDPDLVRDRDNSGPQIVHLDEDEGSVDDVPSQLPERMKLGGGVRRRLSSHVVKAG